VVGSVAVPNSLETFYLRAFYYLGWQPRGIDALRVLRVLPRGALYLSQSFSRVTWRATLKRIRRHAERSDLVLFVKAKELVSHPAAVKSIVDSISIPCALIAPDALSTFMSPDSVALWCEQGGTIFSFAAEAESSRYGVSKGIVALNFAYDPAVHFRPIDGHNQTREAVLFVGTWDPEREATVRRLSSCFQVNVLGPGWLRARDPGKARIVGGVVADASAHRQLVAEHAVTLNLLRAQNLGSQNMRVYETPAQGGYSATYPAPAPPSGYGISSSSIDGLVSQIETFISRPRSEKLVLVSDCQQAVIGETYATRAIQILRQTQGIGPEV